MGFRQAKRRLGKQYSSLPSGPFHRPAHNMTAELPQTVHVREMGGEDNGIQSRHLLLFL